MVIQQQRFNPCRVFSGLATFADRERYSCDIVSFNPCRVFSGLATEHIYALEIIRYRCFNPCRVFSGLATLSPPLFFQKIESVSIPVGFFQALQQD